jgi:hypothetical protein
MNRKVRFGFRQGVCTLLLAGTAFLAAPVSAQSDEERAGARAAAEAGMKAFTEGRWSESIDLFSRAESLVNSPVHLLYLARAYEKVGRLVKAREHYFKVVNQQLPPDALDILKETHRSASEELHALEPRIPYVSVVVQGAGARDVVILMDGERVPQALVGVPRPVDPGEHKFQAFAEGMESAPNTVTLSEGRQETLVLTVVATSHPPPGAAAQGPPEEDRPPESGANGMKIAGFVSLGVGVVGLGVGTLFGLKALSKRSDADDLADTCTGTGCRPEVAQRVERLDDEATSANTLSIVGFAVGGVGIGAGVTLLLLSGGGSAEARAPGVEPWVGLGSAGLRGRF